MTDYLTALAALREALTKLREHDGGTRYNGDDDDVGERACCRVASWKPHDSDCPHAVAVAEFGSLLAALDAARGEAVERGRIDEFGELVPATVYFPALQAPPAALAVPADDKPGPDWKFLCLHRAEVMGRWAARAVELGYEGVNDALESLAQQPAAAVQKGWKEAAIAWEVCASIHRKYGKGKDALFSTRQKDFMAGAEKARAMLAAAERKGE